MAVGGELAKKLGVFILGSIIVRLGIKAANNILDGKTVLGRKKPEKGRTFVDWKGNVILGKADYSIS